MSLFAPLFLLGLGLLALPFWLHRLNVENPERESFASAMFLEPTKKRVHIRKKLRYFLLMAARLLFLALLVFAFSRPILETTSPLLAGTNQVHIVVIDTSASMSAEDRFDRVQDQAASLISQLTPGESMEIYSFDSRLDLIQQRTNSVNTLGSAVDRLSATSLVADMGGLMASLSLLQWPLVDEQGARMSYQVHLISDFQKAAMPDRFADLIPSLPADIEIGFNFYPVSASQGNWAIDFVREEDRGLRIGVRGFETPQQTVDIDISQDGNTLAQASLSVGESGQANLLIPLPELPAAYNQLLVSLSVDDALEQDNSFHYLLDRRPPQPVLLLTANPFAPAATYLSAVIGSIGEAEQGGSVEYQAQVFSLSEFDERTLSRYQWLILDDIGSLSSTMTSALRAYVESGGSVFASVGDQTALLPELPVTGHNIESTNTAQDNQFFQIAQVDSSHSVLGNLSGWSELRFSKALSIEAMPEDQSLVWLDSESPLLIEHRLGQGKLLLLTSSLDNQWNNLPVKPLYVSLMAEIAAYMANLDRVQTQLYTGDTLNLREISGGTGQLVDPQGDALLALQDVSSLGLHRLDQTGFYQLFSAASEVVLATNLHPSESDLTELNSEEVEQWLSELHAEGSESGTAYEAQLPNAALVETRTQEFWLPLLILGALVLIFESLMANTYLAGRPVDMERN